MGKNRAWSAVFAIAAAPFACGGGGGGNSGVDAPRSIDAPSTIDSPSSADAPADATPDAQQFDFSCLGSANPTTTTATTITVGGLAQTISSNVQVVPAVGATVKLFKNGNNTPLDTKTTGSDGTFSFTPQVTLGQAQDLFVTATGSGSADAPYEFFPAAPLVADDAAVPIYLIPASDLMLLGQQSGQGAFGLVVTDCSNVAIGGASVTSDPGGSGSDLGAATHLQAFDGFYAVANVTPGSATITTESEGQTFRERTLTSVANTLVATQIKP